LMTEINLFYFIIFFYYLLAIIWSLNK
jgi:hypothetical protein